MGYLMMCVLSTRARRCSSCVFPFLCPRGNLSTWCVDRSVVAATLPGVPRARQRDRVVGLLWVVMRPPDPVATERAGLRRVHAASWKPRLRPRWRLDARWIVDTMPRRHAVVDLARPGRANGHPPDQVTRKRRELSRTMWAVEHELQEPRAEGRAIDPAAVGRMFDATLGEHISPGELEQIWRGQPGPPAERSWPAGAWYCTGINWAQTRDDTVAAVVRCDTTPLQLVAVYRTQRRPWPMMAAQVGALLDAFPGAAAHDATGAGNAMREFPALAAHDQLQGVTLVGRVRTDLFPNYIGAIERDEIVGPRIDVFYTEHLYCGEDDLFGSGHPPDTVVAMALAYHAFKTGRRPSEATPARAPAGETR